MAMEPEISIRCSECGAAVRPGTLFCPECGQPADKHGLAESGTDENTATESMPGDEDGTATASVVPDPPAAEEPIRTEEVEKREDEPEPVVGDTDPAPTIAASVEREEAGKAKDPLSDHLEKLKTASEAAPGAIVMTPSRKGLKRKSSSSREKKPSKGRLVFSRFASLRRSDTPRPGRIEPGLRFLLVAGVLVVFAVVAYYFSRYLR